MHRCCKRYYRLTGKYVVKPLQIIVIYRRKHIIKFKFHERQYRPVGFKMKTQSVEAIRFSISFDNPLKLTKTTIMCACHLRTQPIIVITIIERISPLFSPNVNVSIWFEYVWLFSSWWLTAVVVRIIFMIFGSTLFECETSNSNSIWKNIRGMNYCGARTVFFYLATYFQAFILPSIKIVQTTQH